MNYLRPKWVHTLGGKAYNDGWERTFGGPRCGLCNESADSCAERKCAFCKQPVLVCVVCGDGKESGEVTFDHGCDD